MTRGGGATPDNGAPTTLTPSEDCEGRTLDSVGMLSNMTARTAGSFAWIAGQTIGATIVNDPSVFFLVLWFAAALICVYYLQGYSKKQASHEAKYGLHQAWWLFTADVLDYLTTGITLVVVTVVNGFLADSIPQELGLRTLFTLLFPLIFILVFPHLIRLLYYTDSTNKQRAIARESTV